MQLSSRRAVLRGRGDRLDLARDITVRGPQIERAFHDNILVVFGQHLSNERHTNSAAGLASWRFTSSEIPAPRFSRDPLISNIRDEPGAYRVGRSAFTCIRHLLSAPPSRCSCFMRRRCRSATAGRRDTVRPQSRLRSAAGEHEDAPRRLKRSTDTRAAGGRQSAPENSPSAGRRDPDIAHPIVRTHPFTGRKSLYVTAASASASKDAGGRGVELIVKLDATGAARVSLPAQMEVGDLLMWTTRCMHLAIAITPCRAAPDAPHHRHRNGPF